MKHTSYFSFLMFLVLFIAGPATCLRSEVQERRGDPNAGTVLGISQSRFTLNGEPTFLVGFSYYGGLGATPETLRRDFDDLQRLGFNWLRVWATWEAFGENVSRSMRKETEDPFIWNASSRWSPNAIDAIWWWT